MDRQPPSHARRTLQALWRAVEQSEHDHRQGFPEDHARRVAAGTLADEDETISDEAIDHQLTFLQNHGEIYSVNDWVRITDPDDMAPDNSEDGVFRISVADDTLRLLVDANDTEFTILELVDMTGAARSTVWQAIDLLDQLDVVRTRETPQRNHVSTDPLLNTDLFIKLMSQKQSTGELCEVLRLWLSYRN